MVITHGQSHDRILGHHLPSYQRSIDVSDRHWLLEGNGGDLVLLDELSIDECLCASTVDDCLLPEGLSFHRPYDDGHFQLVWTRLLVHIAHSSGLRDGFQGR